MHYGSDSEFGPYWSITRYDDIVTVDRDFDTLSAVVCGVHGCTYDATGCCVRVPSQDNPPSGAVVRAFPVVERGPFVWVWFGTPGAELLRPPPSTSWLEGDGWSRVGEHRDVAASLMLLHEHSLDLTNVFAMHPEMVP